MASYLPYAGRGRPARPAIERFMEKVFIREDGHWEWLGFRDDRGYGQFNVQGSRSIPVHRAAYMLFIGDPGKNHVHHSCENKWCVNPECLEVKSPTTHISEHRKAISVCRQGHPLAGENLVIQKSTGKRSCRICRRESTRALRAKRKARADG